MKNRVVEIFNRFTPNSPMSEEETKLMLSVLMNDNDEFTKDVNEFSENTEIYREFISILPIQIFLSRLNNCTTLKISLNSLILLYNHILVPGKAVMYAFYLHNKLPENTFIDTNIYTSKLFPFGYFSKEDLNEIWDLQKVDSSDDMSNLTLFGADDNLLDYVEIWNK